MFKQNPAERRRGHFLKGFFCLALWLVSALFCAPLASSATQVHTKTPFGVGEQLTYDVLLDSHKVGTAQMCVEDMQKVRGRLAYHIVYTINASAHFLFYTYRVNDRFESWLDAEKLISLRYRELQGREGDGEYRRRVTYEMYPEEANYRKTVIRAEKEDDSLEVDPGVTEPLDPCCLVYFVRTNPLHIQESQRYDNYFKKEHNPVQLRSEMHSVPLTVPETVTPVGRMNTVVVHPTIQDRGMFSKGASAQIWFTDDTRYLPVQISFKEKLGLIQLSVRLRLKAYRAPQSGL